MPYWQFPDQNIHILKYFSGGRLQSKFILGCQHPNWNMKIFILIIMFVTEIVEHGYIAKDIIIIEQYIISKQKSLYLQIHLSKLCQYLQLISAMLFFLNAEILVILWISLLQLSHIELIIFVLKVVWQTLLVWFHLWKVLTINWKVISCHICSAFIWVFCFFSTEKCICNTY